MSANGFEDPPPLEWLGMDEPPRVVVERESPRRFYLVLHEGCMEWIPGSFVWRPFPAWADRASARKALRMLERRKRKIRDERRWTIR